MLRLNSRCTASSAPARTPSPPCRPRIRPATSAPVHRKRTASPARFGSVSCTGCVQWALYCVFQTRHRPAPCACFVELAVPLRLRHPAFRICRLHHPVLDVIFAATVRPPGSSMLTGSGLRWLAREAYIPPPGVRCAVIYVSLSYHHCHDSPACGDDGGVPAF